MDYLIMCRSLTYAQRIANALDRAGVRARVLRAPAELSPTGCGHAVRLPPRYLTAAMPVLKHTGLPYQGIYVGSAAESYREVSP